MARTVQSFFCLGRFECCLPASLKGKGAVGTISRGNPRINAKDKITSEGCSSYEIIFEECSMKNTELLEPAQRIGLPITMGSVHYAVSRSTRLA
jgi:hypothetical protein